MTHICVGKLTIIGSDNGLSPERRQAIIWTNAGIVLIGPLGTNFSEILIEIQTFSLKKIRLKMSSAKCCSFRLGLNVLIWFFSQMYQLQPWPAVLPSTKHFIYVFNVNTISYLLLCILFVVVLAVTYCYITIDITEYSERSYIHDWFNFATGKHLSSLESIRLNSPCMVRSTWTRIAETWWRHQMESIFCVTGPLCGEFTDHRPVTRSYDVFFDLRLE